MDNEDLTSINTSSDDVFFNENTLKAKAGRKFSRNNPLRQQVYTRKDGQNNKSDDNDGDDEYEGGENDRFNEEPPDENETEEGARSRRNIPKVNYKLFNREGRKN